MKMPKAPRVCVIGAGPAGLAMIRRLLQAHVTGVTVYERQGELGGNWARDDPSGHTSVYDAVRSISSKTMTAMEDFPFPPGADDYPDRTELLRYLRGYAGAFDLLPYIRFNTEVKSVRRGANGMWVVVTQAGAEDAFDYVCICTGHHWDPRMPDLPGNFSGRLLHSHAFRNSLSFTRDRVLVVGCGNSGADIALDVARRNGQVTLSMRRGYHVIPRYLFGVPADVFYARLRRWVPHGLLRPLAQSILWGLSRAHGFRGLPEPDHKLFETHPLINSDLLPLIRDGRITVVGAVAAIDGGSVGFSCGASGVFDTLIACTGYRVSFPFLGPEVWNPPAGREMPELVLRIFHPESPGLYFLGLFQPSGSIWPLADLQARLVAAHIADRLPFPARIEGDKAYAGTYVDSPRHALEVDAFEYRRLLLRNIGRLGHTPR
jgi:Flavin-binding monooxygenase-like